MARNFQLRFIFNNNKPRETFDGFLREVCGGSTRRYIGQTEVDELTALLDRTMTKSRISSSNIGILHLRRRKSVSRAGTGVLSTCKVCSIRPLTSSYSLSLYHHMTAALMLGQTYTLGSDLAFLVSNKTGFEIPLEKISNSNMAGKNEVSLEFALSQPPPAGKRSREDELVEMRLFIPSTYVRDADGDEDAKMDVDGDTDGALSAAQIFHDMIKDKAEIGQVTGEHIAVFEDVNVTTPRSVFFSLLVAGDRLNDASSDLRHAEVASTSICSRTSSDYEGRCTTTRSFTLRSPVSSSSPNQTMSTSRLSYVSRCGVSPTDNAF